ncbi:LuxR family transcriptional regulator [Streptomyces venezuelae]|uniref:LuxR family transcriptional regulator n=1 Tax=Streptomyces venezuelae TaxID=54571 RepID=A0A5P2D3F2_STRVZ|nr:helix-turn-helix transcriptional regulator [Streptomyces venezuelae]QES49070.1 LuxR family transcriptional regulator [Streptomyces venezuelae]
MTRVQHTHGLEELCEAGSEVYAAALRRGRVRREEAARVPCLIDLGLLHPDPQAMEWLRPTDPAVALHVALRDIDAEIHAQRLREAKVARSLEQFQALGDTSPAVDAGGIVVLEGVARINAAIERATHACERELLCIEPRTRCESILEEALPRHLRLRERGVHTRSVYGRASLHNPALRAFMAALGDAFEVRSVGDVPQRMIIMDSTVAFVPASPDRRVALELRHPALVDYLISVFERFWHQALPFEASAPALPGPKGVSERQFAIARLLAEGHADKIVAQRLGISVRTCRKHIAHLAELLGSANRVQLGVLIARSGLLAAPPDPH